MNIKPALGTCYYPEHWSQNNWKDDAKRMADLGLSLVRIGEFAWSKIEPTPGNYCWQWLDQAIEALGNEGLQVVLGTPTATPPRWMLDRHPDMLAFDEQGRARKFGSRRHYCFSHSAYRQEAAKIAELMAQRYAQNDHLHSWQIDNEYGCHDTVISYSDNAKIEFSRWLKEKYQSIDELNRAWGNVFWSMEYTTFTQIELPNLTVTEANPSHAMDFRRFSSDQVVRFNRAQADAIRKYSDKPLIHNYMGRITEFDHYKVGDGLDIASWDSYPLGFLVDRSGASEEWQRRFERQGDPDFQAFHHDLYRQVGRGRWWVMEQQPGPVNWAPFNPAPLPGMVRFWTWEAIAHEAEAVCYFRWRQARFAQEQMHAGLLKPDSSESATFAEVEQVAAELQQFGEIESAQPSVALVFDYESCWAWETQPQGQGFDAFSLVFDFYRALRRLGMTVDIIRPDVTSLGAYKLVLIPGLFQLPKSLVSLIESFDGAVLVGPRSGSRDQNFQIPVPLPPAINGFDCTVDFVETFSKKSSRELQRGGSVHTWLEAITSSETIHERLVDGSPVLVAKNNLHYLAAWPDSLALLRMIQEVAEKVGIECERMADGVRQRETASHTFLFNHNAHEVTVDGETIPAAGVKIRKK